MTQCAEIKASRASQYPPLLPRKTVTETDRIENDISQDVDCQGAGVTIVTSVWAIHPDDDDATLVLETGSAFVAGLVTFCPYSGGTAGKSYRVTNTVTLSDGTLGPLEFTVQVVIAETVKIAFANG